MNVLKRISTLIAANINHFLDQAENPEIMIKQLIREMEEGIIELRRETAKAIAHEKFIEKKIQEVSNAIEDLENKALQVLEKDNEDLTRKIVQKKSEMEEELSFLKTEKRYSQQNTKTMKEEMVKLEDKAQLARRKKEELVRRSRIARAQLQTNKYQQKTKEVLDNFDLLLADATKQEGLLSAYEQKIADMESEAQAYKDVFDSEKKGVNIENLEKKELIENELGKLKKKVKKKKSKRI